MSRKMWKNCLISVKNHNLRDDCSSSSSDSDENNENFGQKKEHGKSKKLKEKKNINISKESVNNFLTLGKG